MVCVDYANIAGAFDKTRAYVWPCVRRFLDERANFGGSLLEAGCGNGRNLILARQLHFTPVVGFDICPELVDLSTKKGLDIYKADILEPIQGSWDICLCIAVIHHLDTEEKRCRAIQNLYNCLNPGGELLITVWSYEKDHIDDQNRKSTMQKDFQLGDNWVPWRTKDGKDIINNRFYYIYNKDRLCQTLDSCGFTYQLEWEEQNWIVRIKK